MLGRRLPREEIAMEALLDKVVDGQAHLQCPVLDPTLPRGKEMAAKAILDIYIEGEAFLLGLALDPHPLRKGGIATEALLTDVLKRLALLQPPYLGDLVELDKSVQRLVARLVVRVCPGCQTTGEQVLLVTTSP